MRSSSSKGWWALGAMAAYFAGCGGSSVRHGANEDDTKGHGGTTGGTGAQAGMPGVQAGRGGSGAQGGGPSVGAGAGPARGGTGGGSTTVTGGTSGTAGTAGTPEADPGCDCDFGLDGDRTFSCSSPNVSVPSEFAEPAKCEVPDARVKRESCYGTTHYTFIEGEENEYHLEVNSEGKATYFSASGYVSPGCGLDPGAFDYGTVERGMPTDGACWGNCALCQAYDDLPTCEMCEPDPDVQNAVRQSFDQYCANNYCPATAAEARAHVMEHCDESYWGRISKGCGLVTVLEVVGWWTVSYLFDEQSGALRGVNSRNDSAFGPCQVGAYLVGDLPDGPCAGQTTCTLCGEDTGEAGAGAGAAGAAGEGNGSACLP